MIYIGYDEIWEKIKIKGYKCDYSVSQMGNIRNDNSGKILKHSKSTIDKKRHVVCLHLTNKKTNEKKLSTLFVSRLVAIAFIPIPDRYLKKGYTISDLQVDHIRDGDPTNHDDNTIYNLQWLTQEENIKKAKEHNLMNKVHMKGKKQPTWGLRGEANPSSKYTNEFIRSICEDLIANKMSYYDISKKYNVSKGYIGDIKSGKSWKHITKDYDFSNYINKNGLNYPPGFAKKLDELIVAGADNDEIRKTLGLELNKTTSAIISNHRQKLNMNVASRTAYDKEMIKKMDDMIGNGFGTDDIINELKLENSTKIRRLIIRHRSKLKKIN